MPKRFHAFEIQLVPRHKTGVVSHRRIYVGGIDGGSLNIEFPNFSPEQISKFTLSLEKEKTGGITYTNLNSNGSTSSASVTWGFVKDLVSLGKTADPVNSHIIFDGEVQKAHAVFFSNSCFR